MVTDVLALSKALIEIDTTNPPGTQHVIVDVISAAMRRAGMRVELKTVDSVTSVFGILDFGVPGPSVCWIGHWDVVPPGDPDAWTITKPFVPLVRDGNLYGRGACDMKTGVAAAIAAGAEIARSIDCKGTLVLAVFGDEESGGVRGAASLMKPLWNRFRFEYGIVGEPTDFHIKAARRGVIWGTIIFHGIQAHAAWPHTGDNPISKAAKAVSALENIRFDITSHPLCGRPTLSVTEFHAGEKQNVIPGSASLSFDIRSLPSQTPETIRKELNQVLSGIGLIPETDFSIQIEGIAEPYATSDRSFVETCRDIVRSLTGREPEIRGDGGTSDGRFLAYLGVPVIEIGLENETLHKVNESCPVTSLYRLANLYRKLFQTLLSRHQRG